MLWIINKKGIPLYTPVLLYKVGVYGVRHYTDVFLKFCTCPQHVFDHRTMGVTQKYKMMKQAVVLGGFDPHLINTFNQ